MRILNWLYISLCSSNVKKSNNLVFVLLKLRRKRWLSYLSASI